MDRKFSFLISRNIEPLSGEFGSVPKNNSNALDKESVSGSADRPHNAFSNDGIIRRSLSK